MRRRLLSIVLKFKEDENMDKFFFHGELRSQGNFRREEVYQFLDDLQEKMELKEVSDNERMDFLNRHLSVTAKTIVGSTVKDFDEAVSKLIEVYGNAHLITSRMLIEAEEKILP